MKLTIFQTVTIGVAILSVGAWSAERGSARFVPANAAALPSEFYIVNTWDDDFYPYWQATITHVAQTPAGLLVRYAYIESATQPCGEPDIKATEKLLPTDTVTTITAPVSLCSLDSEKINTAAHSHSRKPRPFETLRAAVVTTCGNTQRVFRLPAFEMNESTLERISPQTVALTKLGHQVLDRTFGSEDLDKLLSQAAGAEAVAGFSKFRSGFWFCFRGEHPAIPASVQTPVDPTFGADCDWSKFQNILASYKHPAEGVRGRNARLVDPNDYKFLRYVPAHYSPIFVQARVQGTVEMELDVDQDTGYVRDVKIVNGSHYFSANAEDAAKQWQFDPKQIIANPVSITLEFAIKCGE
jgi:TonB family protein